MQHQCVMRRQAFVVVVGKHCFCDWVRAVGAPGGVPSLQGLRERATGMKQRRRVSKVELKECLH